MNRRLRVVLVTLAAVAVASLFALGMPAQADEKVYAHVESASSGDVTLTVSYDDPIAGQPLTLHVAADGGSGTYKYYMSAPAYSDDGVHFESVMDPAHMPGYTGVEDSHDYQFAPMASGTYQFQFQIMDMNNTSLYLRKTVAVSVDDANYPSVSQIVNSAVSQCEAETDGSQYAKALWLHDWLINQLDYDNSLTWSSSESALCRGTGTCQAYESAYAKLLTAAGIENEETRDADDAHTWNAAKLDGVWCQIDCTWDDSDNSWYGFDQRHLYFGLTDELMGIAHPKWKDSTDSTYGAHQTSLANNYFVRNGEAAQWAGAYEDAIKGHIAAGETSFSVDATNASNPASISGIVNGLIAYQLEQSDWSVNGTSYMLKVTGSSGSFDIEATAIANPDKPGEPKPDQPGGPTTYEIDQFAELHKDDVPDGLYRFAPANRADGCLDVSGASTANGAVVQVWAGNGTDAQAWRVSHDSKGYVILTAAFTNKVLDVSSASTANGVRLQLWQSNDTKAQRWVAVKGADGSLTLVSALSGRVTVGVDGSISGCKAIDLPAGATTNGTRLQLWDSNGTGAQHWLASPTKTWREQLDELAEANAGVIADGTYVFVSLPSGRGAIDVASGSRSSGANVRLWTSNATSAQRWKVSHDANGYITLANVGSGLVLDVSGGSTSSGANVQQYSSNESWAQKWIAVLKDDGNVELRSALKPGLTLDLSAGGKADGTNLQVWDANGTAAQAFYPVKANPAVAKCDRDTSIENKWFVISPVSNGPLAFDVSAGSTSNGANVQGWSANGTLAQVWKFVWEDGYYRIVNANSGASLDVANGDVVPGANVQQWATGEGNSNQLFAVSKTDDGYLLAVNKGTGLALALSRGNIVGAASDPSSTSQQLALSEATANLPDGVYNVAPGTGPSLSLDVSSGSLADGANVQSYASNGSFAQMWYLGTADDGTRYLESVGSAKRLTVSSDGNVCQKSANSSGTEQKWTLAIADGGYEMRSVAKSGYSLDVSGGSAASGANVGVYASNGTAAQKFRFISTDPVLASGMFVIRSASNPSVSLDVSGGSYDAGANVQAWAFNDSGAQKWNLRKGNDGYCSITNAQSEKSLDVANGNGSAGANVQQWDYNGSNAQRWRLVYMPGGFRIVSALNGNLYLSVAGGANSGANVRLNNGDSADAQGFLLTKTNYVPKYHGWQNPSWMYQVSSNSVSVPHAGSGIFGFATRSRIPLNATRSQCVEAMISRAYEYLGTPYRWDYSCEAGVGVDCAGLVMQALYATGMDLSPFNPWDHYYTPGHDHYANDMWNSGRFMHVSWANRQRGDLISWNGHIAIYLGNDQMIEATSPRVRVASVYVWGGVRGVIRPFA